MLFVFGATLSILGHKTGDTELLIAGGIIMVGILFFMIFFGIASLKKAQGDENRNKENGGGARNA